MGFYHKMYAPPHTHYNHIYDILTFIDFAKAFYTEGYSVILSPYPLPLSIVIQPKIPDDMQNKAWLKLSMCFIEIQCITNAFCLHSHILGLGPTNLKGS